MSCAGCLGPEATVRLCNPGAVRPWQHVLERLGAYLMIVERLCTAPEGIDDAWNIGPDAAGDRPVSVVAEALVEPWDAAGSKWHPDPNAPTEAKLLTLDNTRLRTQLGWRPHPDFEADDFAHS